MNKQQYGLLVIMLASVGQISTAFDNLDNDELLNLEFLLHDAYRAAADENKRRHVTDRQED
jgi:hypothetical protein